MINENLVAEIKAGINVKQNMELLYSSNLGLISTIANSWEVYDYDLRNDFFQLAYIALDTAVKSYDGTDGYSLMAYFRRCLLHEYYTYRLEMQFPLRVSRNAYREHKSALPAFHLDNGVKQTFTVIDESYDKVEEEMLNDVLWSEVANSLSEENYFVIYERFKGEKTLREIACELQIGSERVRLREQRSLNRLRKNKNIQKLAYDYFEI